MTAESLEPTPPFKRAGLRARRRARREGRIARRETYFDLMASGFSCERIAEEAKVSAATVRREVDLAIAERRLDAPERYAHLQVARLSKALRVADASLEQGDMKAGGPFLRVVAALDRYHGLAPARSAQARAATPPLALPAPPLALPAPPLALTHAAPVPDAEPPLAAEAMEDGSAA